MGQGEKGLRERKKVNKEMKNKSKENLKKSKISLFILKGEDGRTTVRSSRLIRDSETSSNENIKYQVG